LPQSPLRPGARNLFAVTAPGSFTHVRLTIYPDGGVARLRVHGVVDPAGAHPRERDTETARRVAPDLVDLVALHGGGQALACSDMFFGAMHQLIQPGRARHMGEGWETRRRRAPGHDWILLALAGRGVLDTVELDTNHFKGNYPDECALEGILAPGARITDLIASSDWQPVLPRMPLEPSTRHWYRDELVDGGPFTHLRLSIYPDGGISRLRAWGRLV
jgi:allantoicase